MGFIWTRILPTPILRNDTQRKIVTISSCAQSFTVTTNIHRTYKRNKMSHSYPKQRANVPIYKELLQINKKKKKKKQINKKNTPEGKNWSEVMNRKGN